MFFGGRVIVRHTPTTHNLHRVHWLSASFVVFVVSVIAGCGSDGGPSGGSDASEDLTSSIAAALVAIEGDGALVFTPPEADCVAAAVVDDFDRERLIELQADQGTDLTGLAWTTAERNKVLATLRDCVDLESQLTELFAADPSLTAGQATCLAKSYLGSKVFPEALFSTMPDEDLNARIDAELAATFESCT
jgi:hypothetical protein